MQLHTTRRFASRQAFTLIEVSLAVALSVILVLALYVSLQMQFEHARTAREIIDETNVVRSVLAKINTDLAGIQGPISPYLNASNAYGSYTTTLTNTSSNSGSGTSGGTGSSGGTSGTSGGSSGGSSNSSNSGNSTTSTNSIFYNSTNLGVIGASDSVMFTCTRMPKQLSDMIGSNEAPPTPQCEIRRITYAVTQQGLVRQEDTNVFDGSVNPQGDVSPTASLGDSSGIVIAPQVIKMQLQYYGNGGWVSDWNSGTASETTSYANANNSVQYYQQQGPPIAIQFTLTMKLAGGHGSAREVTVSHIVAVQTANRNGPLPPPPQAGN